MRRKDYMMAEGPSEEPKETEKFVIVPLGEEAKRITQVISSDTARQILEALSESPLSTSQISEKLNIPLTTAQYQVEKLMEAGLIKVERIRRSEKMREMKIYAPIKKLIVVVPERISGESVTSVLRKYLAIVVGVVIISGLIEFISQSTRIAPEMVKHEALPMAAPARYMPEAAEVVTEAEPLIQTFLAHPGLWFLLGGVFVILILGAHHYIKSRK
jgi:DNA-binding transcriptional ArsR family regulator